MAGLLTKTEARGIAFNFGISLNADFHTLSNVEVARILDAATRHGYRKPRNANGSKARYFHAYLARRANRESGDEI